MIHDHGGPDHNRALDKAADYFHDAYGGTMVHLLGLQPLAECWHKNKDADASAVEGRGIERALRSRGNKPDAFPEARACAERLQRSVVMDREGF